MIAVDTNVVVRLLAADDPRQTERVRILFENETILLPKTVLLEVAWVMRRLYGFKPAPVIQVLDELTDLPNVRCEDEPAVRQAFMWARQGMDLADAFHLASSRTASRFATFDRRMIRIGAKSGLNVTAP